MTSSVIVSMGTEFKDVDVNMEDSGNSCGSSVVSDYSGPSDHTDFDGDGVQVSDLEGDADELRLPQVRTGLFALCTRRPSSRAEAFT